MHSVPLLLVGSLLFHHGLGLHGEDLKMDVGHAVEMVG